jgi:hypothetical protein
MYIHTQQNVLSFFSTTADAMNILKTSCMKGNEDIW